MTLAKQMLEIAKKRKIELENEAVKAANKQCDIFMSDVERQIWAAANKGHTATIYRIGYESQIGKLLRNKLQLLGFHTKTSALCNIEIHWL